MVMRVNDSRSGVVLGRGFKQPARLSLIMIWLFSVAVLAADTEDKMKSCDADCVAVGEWQFSVGLGAGVRLNPLVDGDDTPLIVLPEVSYYGNRFFLRNLEFGFSLLETERHQLNVVATPSYDQMYFNRWDPLNLSFSGGPGSGSTGLGEVNFSTITVSGRDHPSDGSLGPTGTPIPDPVEPSDLTLRGSTGVYVEINGTRISSSIELQGMDGNVISVSIRDGALAIDNLSANDQLVLVGDGPIELLDQNGKLADSSSEVSGANRISLSARGNSYVVSADPEAQAPPATKISYDNVSKRRISGLAGFEYGYYLPWMSAHLQVLQDVTGVHGGQEYRAALVFPWDFRTSKLALTVGANYKSEKVLDYYYGLDAADTVAAPNLLYSINSAGTETLLRLDWQRPITDKWTLRARLQYLDLPSQTVNSPLVAEDHVLSVFIGGVYHF
jgi:outer membrane scaffolding protein for murein synthesis (MipA/OmpV family)